MSSPMLASSCRRDSRRLLWACRQLHKCSPCCRLKPLDVAPMPESRLRRSFFLLAYNPWFDRFMLCTIIVRSR